MPENVTEHDRDSPPESPSATPDEPSDQPKDNGWSAEEISELINQHEHSLLAYAYRMLGGDWQSAQDAVQETFLRLCREPREKITDRVRPWLFTVCRSRVIDMQRTQHSHTVDANKVLVADPHPDAAEIAMATEQSIDQESVLARLVTQLTPRQQEILRLRMQAGLSYREIAKVTGLTVSNVGFHLHAAVRSLKSSLATS